MAEGSEVLAKSALYGGVQKEEIVLPCTGRPHRILDWHTAVVIRYTKGTHRYIARTSGILYTVASHTTLTYPYL